MSSSSTHPIFGDADDGSVDDVGRLADEEDDDNADEHYRDLQFLPLYHVTRIAGHHQISLQWNSLWNL